MVTWESSLPQAPQLDGYEETLPQTVIRSDMSTGPAKVRRRSTTDVTKYKMTFNMTLAQVATFETFFNDTTVGGSLSFEFEEPRTQTTKTFRFDLSEGPPSISPLSHNLFAVSCAMEKLP